MIEHPGAVAIIPMNEKGEVVMVRQYRYSVDDEILEIPAGKIEKGDIDLIYSAKRELMEETGFDAKELIPLGSLYPSPGYSSEIIYLFLAKNLEPKSLEKDEDEFMDVECIPIKKLIEMIMAGEIKDSKTQVGIFKAYELLKSQNESVKTAKDD